MRTWTLALSLVLAACSGNPDVPQDLAGVEVHPDLAGADGANAHAPDLAGAPDGAAGCTVSTSPSGYSCDPWSVHLYGAAFVSASAMTLRLELLHNPAIEGAANDFVWPPEHDFSQLLTVDFPIDDALRSFLCVVLAPSTPPASYPVDASLIDLAEGIFTLTSTPGGQVQRWQNVSDLCRVASLPVVVTPQLVMKPQLPDVAVIIPLLPDPRGLTVGAQVSGWLARGILYQDEDRELVPVIHGTVVKIVTMPCQDPAHGDC